MAKSTELHPNDPQILFGMRLQSLRKEKGWSQEQLALECGMARSYLGGVERGHRNISLLNICKLARTLEVDAFQLLIFD